MRSTKQWRILAALAAFALVAAACGGDDDGDGNDTTTEDGGDAGDEEDAGDDAEDEEDAGDDGGEASGEGMPEFEEGSTMAALQEQGYVRVGTKADQPLFGVEGPQGWEGFDVEIAKLIVEGIFGSDNFDPEEHIEFSEAVSAVREQVLQDDQVDMVVATYTINDERAELVGFAGPYYVAGQDIMVEEGNPEGIESVDDMNGQPVCSVEGSTSIDNLREMAPDAEVIALDTYSACAEELSQGNVTAVTTDNVILIGLIEERGEFELVGNPFTDEPYGIGVQLEADDFRHWINERLQELYDSGEWGEAWDATAGVIAETPEPPEIDDY